MLKKIRRFFSKKGQGLVEYALLLGFVAIVTVGLFTNDGLYTKFRTTLQSIANRFTTFNEHYGSSPLNPENQNNNPQGS